MDLNSRVSSIDFQHMADVAKSLGADDQLQDKILQANTSIEVYKLCQQQQLPLVDKLCQQALNFAQGFMPSSTELEIFAIDRQGEFIGYASNNPHKTLALPH